MTHLQLTVCKESHCDYLVFQIWKVWGCYLYACYNFSKLHLFCWEEVLQLCRHCCNVTGSSHSSSATTSSKPRQSSNQSIGETILCNNQGQVAHKLRHVIATVVFHSYIVNYFLKKKATVFYSQKAAIFNMQLCFIDAMLLEKYFNSNMKLSFFFINLFTVNTAHISRIQHTILSHLK